LVNELESQGTENISLIVPKSQHDIVFQVLDEQKWGRQIIVPQECVYIAPSAEVLRFSNLNHGSEKTRQSLDYKAVS
jgi:hypothetical protein